MSLAAGSKLVHYEILGPLGAGAMGEFWRARDTKLGREVAIKVLPEHFADDEERLKRFEREAQTLASLNHPNVAQIHGVDQVGDTCFLVLELVPGESLEERLRHGPLPVDEALDVCRQIAEGLEGAQQAGVIHRDLKPANVRRQGQGARQRNRCHRWARRRARGRLVGGPDDIGAAAVTLPAKAEPRGGCRFVPDPEAELSGSLVAPACPSPCSLRRHALLGRRS